MRWLGWLVVGGGAFVAVYSVVAGLLAPTTAGTLVYLVPEAAGCLLIILGLHMALDP